MSPDLWHLSLHRWQMFCTLTFRSRNEQGQSVKVPNADCRRKMLFAFLRECAKGEKRDRNGKRISSIPFRKLLWAAREERGERKGRYHFHILLSGLPPERVNVTETFVQKSIWAGVCGGHSDFRMFDSRLPGVQYVLKGLEQWSQRHANAYEVGKYCADEDRTLILADAYVSKWAQESGKPGASGSSRSTVITGVRPSAILRGGNHRTTETPRGLYVLNMHPAGVSVVR